MQRLALQRLANEAGVLSVAGAMEGLDALHLTHALFYRGGIGLFIARDSVRADQFARSAHFFAPDMALLRLPAWDCLPYDRVSPAADMAANRAAILSELAMRDADDAAPLLVVTSANSILQRIPPREVLAQSRLLLTVGETVAQEDLLAWLSRNGYSRVGTVLEPGDFALRGGVMDIFAPGQREPVRLDFFGDALDGIRTFDPATQRSNNRLEQIRFTPVSEVLLGPDEISRFRRNFVATFGAVPDGDAVYDAVSAGSRPQGVEHWMPLFYEDTETIFSLVGPKALIIEDHLVDEALAERQAMISDYFQSRQHAPEAKGKLSAPIYRALEPTKLYLGEDEIKLALHRHDLRRLSPFPLPPDGQPVDMGGRAARNFNTERQTKDANVFEAVVAHVDELRKSGKQVVIAAVTEGSCQRLQQVLEDHGLRAVSRAEGWDDVTSAPKTLAQMVVLGLDTGFATQERVFIAEPDILGDRLARGRRKRRAKNFISEAGSLEVGDLVVHVDHGIGSYQGLQTIEVQGAPHDCLQLEYSGGDKLFLPVENIELLSRYGSEAAEHKLDRLGGSGWQARKAKAKKRLLEMAEDLIRIAAARELKTADKLTPTEGAWEEFCARFPYTETDDQLNAIEDVLEDFGKGRPMDRLVCGDVGFGKTEVALRAAFIAALSGRQVTVVAPTTLLARQHFQTFSERFRGWPIQVRHLSRMVTTKSANETRKGLADGRVDIVVGTHAVLADKVKFNDLGLMVIDEEQRFGVKHKEKLKTFRANVHVLTLTATPIPRTLQMALTGIRELSLIATPPVDRLAIRTYVSPFDPMSIREALLRERFRGGQSFFVVPRIADLPGIEEFLAHEVPEVSFIVAHGQMPSRELEDIMTAFYEGKYDVLLSTTIVESGLDIPTANTLIVHRADMFGLAQLYQLRGRVGRSKVRAYAYLTTPNNFVITKQAEQRLRVLAQLDSLGAGFSLASHDLDIRGGGNLLGEEQSGQIRDVGVELYQSMLEEAVAELRADGPETDDNFSPQISAGVSVLIPDSFVSDLDVRLSLYRRLANLPDAQAREEFAAELIDRFGNLPDEVKHLLTVMGIKADCLRAGIEKLEAGPKGLLLTFRNNVFADPAALVELVTTQAPGFKLRSDHKLFIRSNLEAAEERLRASEKWSGLIAGLLN